MRDGLSPRHAAVPMALALASGIVTDHIWPIPLEVWLVAALAIALLWIVLAWARKSVSSAALILCCLVCLGGARHHLCWSAASDNDLSLLAADEPRLVRVTGRLLDRPEVISREASNKRSAWPRPDGSITTLSAEHFVANGEELPVKGKALIHVSGHLVHCDVGDEVEICGWLSLPSPAKNPGGFDPAAYYRRQGIRCLLSADHPDAVRRLSSGSSLSIWRLAARLRAEGEALFTRDLSPRVGPVASALLFGGRMQMDDDIRDAFMLSGLLHVLAISGMHVAILGLLLWAIGRLAGLSVRGTCALMIVGALAYTLLTDCRPPVIRATVLICLYSSSLFLFQRRPVLSNCLAISALVILLWNPTDMFDIGTELSFLAVLGIVWASSRPKKRHDGDLQPEILPSSSLWKPLRAAFDFFYHRTWDEWSISLAAALFTLPLVAARFHLISPVGVMINVVLAPLSTLVLWCDYLQLGVGLLVPAVSWIFAFPFEWGLRAVLALVEWAAHVKLSHFYVPGPPEWWLAGYYILVFALAFVRPVRRWGSRGWSVLVAWVILGLVWGLRTPNSDSLRCTFLSVGHGGAILIETPDGGTLLYDAGAMQDGRIAQRAVLSALWERRRHGLDAIIVSHADMDHFNGAAGLMQSVPVGSLLVSQQFLDFQQPAVAELCESTAASGVPIRLVREGDRLRLDDQIDIRVLHPGFGRPHSDDNANSIVLAIEFAGRRILLTGDLDGHGQATLLEMPPLPVDVLLSPHHGSRRANPPALAEWAQPKDLVVSAASRVDFKSLRAAYGLETRIASTNDTGAVTFEIHPDGTIERTTYVAEKRSRAVDPML